MKPLDKTVALAVIILSTVLMQIHSIEYWTTAAGATGWAWSIALEGAMLWLWYQKRLFPVRIVAALILIAGPWYVLTSPAIEQLQEKSRIEEKVSALQEEVDQLRASLIRYEENSGQRTGWAGRIDRAQRALDEAREKLETAKDEAAACGVDWRLHMVAGMQAAVLLIVMTTQLLAVGKLRNYEITESVSEKLKAPSKLRQEPKQARTPMDYDSAIKAVKLAISNKLPDFEGKAKALAEHYGFRPADVSMVFNHEERKRSGKETISKKALKNMVDKLWPKSA